MDRWNGPDQFDFYVNLSINLKKKTFRTEVKIKKININKKDQMGRSTHWILKIIQQILQAQRLQPEYQPVLQPVPQQLLHVQEQL